MNEPFLGRITEDMDVCDVNGDKVGSVAHAHRYDLAAVGASTSSMPPEEILEVKSGFLGLGKHLYIPMSTIADVTNGCVFLSASKAEIDQSNWHDKPTHLDNLH